MKVRLVVYLLALALLNTTSLFADTVPPNLSGVVSVSHRFSMAHACPVSADLAITNAHVVDPFPTQKDAPFIRSRWNGGYLDVLSASWSEDLALYARADGSDPFPMFYPLAVSAPAPGEQVWWGAYDWAKPGKALRFRVYSGRVVEVRAGIFSLDTETPGGSSGGCVLNAAGEVVGVIAWGKEMDNMERAAFAVSVWGRWFDLARVARQYAESKEKK